MATLLTALAYPPAALWPLALVMLAPLAAALEPLPAWRAVALGYLYLLARSLAVAGWIAGSLADHYRASLAAGWAFALLLMAPFGIPLASALGLFVRAARRSSPLLAPVLFAALWVLGEWVQGAALGAPWLLTALIPFRAPWLLQAADLGGPWLAGFPLVAFSSSLGIAWARRSWRPLAAGTGLLAAALVYGALRLASLPTSSGSVVRIGVIQASLAPDQRFRPGSAERNLRIHAALSQRLVSRARVDLLVWSETAVDTDLDRSPGMRRALEGLVERLSVPLVTGAPRSAAGRATNSTVLVVPGRGLVQTYDKQRLVPFAEYDPPGSHWLAGWVGDLVAGQPYAAGKDATVFRLGSVAFSTPICFEITYADLIRRFRLRGARLLLNLSNDAWFASGGYASAHFAHAVLRAIESRAPVVRAANGGISAAIDAGGRVLRELAASETGVLVAEVRPGGLPPPYARFGDGPVVAGLSFVALFSALAGRRTERRASRSGSARQGRGQER